MAEKKLSKKASKVATMGNISYEQAILAHKFTCPYYSIWGIEKLTDQSQEVDPNKLQTKNGHCGAQPVWTQKNGESQCDGNCWYIKHFKRLLKRLME